MSGGESLCPECWSEVTFVTEPCCVTCGRPFEFHTTGLARCGACIAEPPRWDRARAAFLYEDPARKLILSFKHGDALYALPALANMAVASGRQLISETDVIVPVPLHRWRLFRRRYNQSALLARAISRKTGTPWLPDTLIRTRQTPSQGHRSAAARRRNVQGAFAVARPEVISGRSVLLIDDVLTTGATGNACALALKQAGAGRVDFLTLARVL